uniref:Chitinase, putative n=1 Tax=Ixodes scapularis TaxID=6945 RepID=A0A1S4KSS0_IXOSC
MCQLNVESFARPDPWTYKVEFIPTKLCSHVVFSVPGLKDWFNDMINYDVYHNATKPVFWPAVRALRLKGPRLLVSVGAFENVTSLIFHVANNADVTARFSRNMVRWLLGNSLDGALFTGMFPARPATRNAMVRLVKKLGSLFKVHQLQLGVVVPPKAGIFQTRNAAVKLAQFVDLLVVKVRKEPSWKAAAESRASMEAAIALLRRCGVPVSKLVLTLSLEASSFRIAEGLEAADLSISSTLPYYVVCERLKQGNWETAFDSDSLSSFIHKRVNHEWVIFDDSRSIDLKMCVLHNASLAGVLVWDISVDDFRGLCGTVHPLLAAVHKSLVRQDPATNVTKLKPS